MKKNAIFVIFLAISLFCNFAMGETIYLIGVEAGTGGTADASTKAITQLGTTITITATPKDGYRFNKWTYPNSDADECEIGSTTSKSTTLKVNGACTVKANFTRQYTVTLTSEESGTVKFKSKTVDKGSSLTIEATPGEGYLFYKWISNSDNCTVNDEKAKKTTVKVNGNCTVKAYFEIKYWITLVAEEGGTCTPDHITQYEPGDEDGHRHWNCSANYGYRSLGKGVPDNDDCYWYEDSPNILHNTKPCVLTYLFIKVDTLKFVWQPDNNTPTQKTADTITVTLFTNHRDTIRAKAVETSRNSSEFRGTGRFSFTITEKEMEEGRLDMPLKLDAKNTRAVIRAEIEGDESHVRERDSMVITYNFIAADSAEILDRDGDGEADYVRVHFARSIEKESIGIDTVFWGEEGDEGRGIEQRKPKKSKDKRRIEAPLIDKISPVPLTAVKHPGQTTNRDIMNGEFNAPTDTLVVTLSEPLVQTAEDAWENLFYLSEDCESEEKWELYVRKPPETDDSETKWTIIVPNDVDLKTGYCLTMNPEAGYTDEAGNATGTSGVIISGEDGGNYLYGLKASPAIAGFKGNRDKWVNPETHEWETIPDTISCIRTETKTSYKADIAIYDNEGHVVATFQRHFGKNLEIGNTLYESPDKSTYSGFLDWDQRTNEGRRVGTGVYIWKIHFTFKGGHKELRVIKTGIRRN